MNTMVKNTDFMPFVQVSTTLDTFMIFWATIMMPRTKVEAKIATVIMPITFALPMMPARPSAAITSAPPPLT